VLLEGPLAAALLTTAGQPGIEPAHHDLELLVREQADDVLVEGALTGVPAKSESRSSRGWVPLVRPALRVSKVEPPRRRAALIRRARD
jgi:hypothetical protein